MGYPMYRRRSPPYCVNPLTVEPYRSGPIAGDAGPEKAPRPLILVTRADEDSPQRVPALGCLRGPLHHGRGRSLLEGATLQSHRYLSVAQCGLAIGT